MPDTINAQTPTVKGNPMHMFTNAELTSNANNLGLLVVQNPESIQNKLLGFIAPESVSLRLMPSPTTADVLNNPSFPNNYVFILPRDWGSIASNEIYGKNGFGTQENFNKALNLMPDINALANAFYKTKLTNTIDAWEITWEYDGYFGVQTAKYRGLEFQRESTNGVWNSWKYFGETIRLMPSPTVNTIIKNPNCPYNYTFIIPRTWVNNPVYAANGFGAQAIHTDIINALPKLNQISGTWLENTANAGADAWEITWKYDGYFGVQTAKYRGLEFQRYANPNTNSGDFSNWQFSNDSHLIGTMRLDYINAASGVNYMGWIKVDGSVILESKYPKLVNYIRTTMTNGKGYSAALGGVTLSNPAGLYPRFVGDQWTGAFQSNPDCTTRVPSDNVDYANKSLGGGVGSSGQTSIPTSIGKSGGRTGYVATEADTHWRMSNAWLEGWVGITMSGSYWVYNPSNQETRPKTKFFSLMIYAGYPII